MSSRIRRRRTPTARAPRKLAALALLFALALAFSPFMQSSAQVRSRSRRARSARTSPAKPAPSAQTVSVPSLPASRTTAATAVPTLDGRGNAATQTPTPAPTQTPAPTPSPTPQPTTSGESIEDDEVVRVTSNLVVVPVSVTNSLGEPVQGLKAADFRLEEQGRAQEVAQVGDADQVPLDIALLFDISSSVTSKQLFSFQQESAARFLKEVMKPVDRAAVITIADKPALVQPLAPADTAAARVRTIPAATTSVPTAFYDAVSFAAKYLAENTPGSRRRVVLVISDGDDNFSERVREQTVAEYEAQVKAEKEGKGGTQAVRAAARADLQSRHRRAVAEVQRAVQSADAVFYSINPGGPSVRLNEISTRAQNSMQQVAEATGGTAFVPAKVEELETVLRQIANELRAQYLLQYYSNSDAPPGKYLSIKVTTRARADARIRARQGYYVAKPK